MKQWTLREVCALVGVSRRAIQGYEKIGMVASTGKNKYGHLLYDEEAVETIRTIKMYRDFGFSVKDTAYLMKADDFVKKVCLKNRLSEMEKDLEVLKANIKIVRKILE